MTDHGFLGLGNAEIAPPKSHATPGSKPSTVLYGESEELNRVVVLTLARCRLNESPF
jgi:hypothetical protein